MLDGFPRTLRQAEEAYQVARQVDGIELQAVIHLQVGRDELRRRLLGRAAARAAATTTRRLSDHRLDVYDAETEPLLGFYAGRGLWSTSTASNRSSGSSRTSSAPSTPCASRPALGRGSSPSRQPARLRSRIPVPAPSPDHHSVASTTTHHGARSPVGMPGLARHHHRRSRRGPERRLPGRSPSMGRGHQHDREVAGAGAGRAAAPSQSRAGTRAARVRKKQDR